MINLFGERLLNMSVIAEIEELESALRLAGGAHHKYQSNFLNWVYDEQWAGFYAAYVLGNLGEITSLTKLTELLSSLLTQKTGPPRQPNT